MKIKVLGKMFGRRGSRFFYTTHPSRLPYSYRVYEMRADYFDDGVPF